MRKIVGIVVGIAVGVLSPVLGMFAVKRHFDNKTRREAEEARPKIEALLDEMIRVIASHKGSKDQIIFSNTVKTVNDERRERDLSVHAGGTHWSLDVSTMLVGKKAEHVCVRLHRIREDADLHIFWPAVIEYWPMEPWLQERLDRLDKLVGNASLMRSIRRRSTNGGEDGTPPTYS